MNVLVDSGGLCIGLTLLLLHSDSTFFGQGMERMNIYILILSPICCHSVNIISVDITNIRVV